VEHHFSSTVDIQRKVQGLQISLSIRSLKKRRRHTVEATARLNELKDDGEGVRSRMRGWRTSRNKT